MPKSYYGKRPNRDNAEEDPRPLTKLHSLDPKTDVQQLPKIQLSQWHLGAKLKMPALVVDLYAIGYLISFLGNFINSHYFN